MEHPLPGNTGVDEKSVKGRCKEEDVVLGNVLSPLVILLTNICKRSVGCRRIVHGRTFCQSVRLRLRLCLHSLLQLPISDLKQRTCNAARRSPI